MNDGYNERHTKATVSISSSTLVTTILSIPDRTDDMAVVFAHIILL